MKNTKSLFVAILLIASYATKAQVAINTDGSNPDSSAILDLKSSNRGFLPPRLTNYQISSTNELNLYNGIDWIGMSGNNALIYLGAYYDGGVVFYIYQSGDPGYVPNEIHGLLCAINDQSDGIQWYNGSYTATGATATAIGRGQANTDLSNSLFSRINALWQLF